MTAVLIALGIAPANLAAEAAPVSGISLLQESKAWISLPKESMRPNASSESKPLVFGLGTSRDVSGEWLRVLKGNYEVLSRARLQSFAGTFGILTLVESFKARFRQNRRCPHPPI